MLTDTEINKIVDHIESLWLENCAAKRYLRTHGIANPTQFLAQEVKNIPAEALERIWFRPIRQAIGQGLQDSQSFAKLQIAVQELVKHAQD